MNLVPRMHGARGLLFCFYNRSPRLEWPGQMISNNQALDPTYYHKTVRARVTKAQLKCTRFCNDQISGGSAGQRTLRLRLRHDFFQEQVEKYIDLVWHQVVNSIAAAYARQARAEHSDRIGLKRQRRFEFAFV